MRSLIDLLASELKMQTPNCLYMAEQMRHIFDHKAKFYKHLIDISKSEAAVSTTGTGTQPESNIGGDWEDSDMPVDEREWRMALDVGKTVDVFKQDPKKGHQMWTKGEIVAVTGYLQDITTKNLKIKFHADVSLGETSYPASSEFIAPYNTLSSG